MLNAMVIIEDSFNIGGIFRVARKLVSFLGTYFGNIDPAQPVSNSRQYKKYKKTDGDVFQVRCQALQHRQRKISRVSRNTKHCIASYCAIGVNLALVRGEILLELNSIDNVKYRRYEIYYVPTALECIFDKIVTDMLFLRNIKFS